MALNKVLGSFKPDNLLAANQELPAVADTLEIAAGQFLLRGSLVNKYGVLVDANDMEVYAVLARDCDTTDGAKEAPVYLTGEFNADAVKMNENVDNKFAVCVAARRAGIFLKPHVKMPPCAPMTLRFKFSKDGYDPVNASIGNSGTWKQVLSRPNIWDWTNENTDWSKAFKGAFTDEDNEASVIAAGDTSSVTDVSSMFAGIYNGTLESGSSYSLVTRNNIIECIGFDISNASDIRYLFTGSSLKHGRFDLSHSTAVSGVYADTYIEKIGNVDCSSAEYIGILFCRCSKLLDVGSIKTSATCQRAPGVFAYCSLLEHFGGLIGDTSNIYNYQTFFQLCHELKQVDIPLNFTAAKNVYAAGAFNGCRALPKTVFINLTNKVTNLQAFLSANYAANEIPIDEMDTSNVGSFHTAFQNMHSIVTIPDLDVSSATNVQRMFKNCYKVKYGILEMYNKLVARGAAITDHSECFTDCGRDTEEGQAALAQIPASWGGLAEG